MKGKDKITWSMKLPVGANILVALGDKVETGQKLAEYKSHIVETFDFSHNLGKIDDQKRDELNQIFKDKMVSAGDAFYSVGIFGNKICFPLTGICLGFDEFKNLKIERTEEEEKEVFSPVDGKVVKIEEGKLVLEFRAKEYEGKGLNGLKAWGEGEVKIMNDIKMLNYQMGEAILFTENLDRAFLLKALVVGANAIVVLGNEEINEVDIEIPILRLEKEVWNEFMKENRGEKRKILVNARMDKLLLVLE